MASLVALFKRESAPETWQSRTGARSVFQIVSPFCAMAVAPRCYSPRPQTVSTYSPQKSLAVTLRDAASGQDKAGDGGAEAKARSGEQGPPQDAHHARHTAGHSCRGSGERTRD